MLYVMQPCKSLIRQCLWLNKYIACSEIFQISMTSEGFCCSFNYVGSTKYGNTKDLSLLFVDKWFKSFLSDGRVKLVSMHQVLLTIMWQNFIIWIWIRQSKLLWIFRSWWQCWNWTIFSSRNKWLLLVYSTFLRNSSDDPSTRWLSRHEKSHLSSAWLRRQSFRYTIGSNFWSSSL